MQSPVNYYSLNIGEQEMIRCGVTCFNDMYYFPEVTAKVANDVGMRGVVGKYLIPTLI